MATSICVSLGKRIRVLRKTKRWRQIDLAEHAGIGKNHISELERGQREIGLLTLQAVAQALGTTPSDILKGL
jgi:transcriptional regulator with XRE-family HTH domain